MSRISITIIALLFFIEIGQGQGCSGFHNLRACSVPGIEGYKKYSASRSVMIEAQRTYQYKLILYGGYDYKLGLCAVKGYYPIHYKIINADDSTVFYDNFQDDYVENVGFTNETTRNVIVEITLLASDMDFKDAEDQRTCLGIAFYWKKVPRLGF